MAIKKIDKDKAVVKEKALNGSKEVVEDKTVSKVKKAKKTKQQLNVELSKIQDEVQLEIRNISIGRCLYMDKYDDAIIDLEPNESIGITLKQAKDICTKSKTFFTEGSLIIDDVYSEDEYSIEDILKYLRLDRVDMEEFSEIEDFIIDSTDRRFEAILKNKDPKYIRRVAMKCLYLNSTEDNDFELSRGKERTLCELLNLDNLIY